MVHTVEFCYNTVQYTILDITYSNVMTEAKHKSDFELITDTP